MLKQAISLRIPRFVARKPIIKHGTYIKYGFVIVRHQYCTCPRCRSVLNAGPNYQPNKKVIGSNPNKLKIGMVLKIPNS